HLIHKINELTDRSYILSWKLSIRDNNSSIIEYIIERYFKSYLSFIRIETITSITERKDYTYYGKPNHQTCSNIQEKNLNSVKHLYITSKEIEDNCVNYFPNVNGLSIKTSVDSIIITLHHIINLLYFTPNVHTLNVSLLFCNININSNKQNEKFQYVLKKNKIQSLVLNGECLFGAIQFIVYLFPRLEYLKTQIERKEIEQILRFLLSKTHNKTRNLFYLCISMVPKVCLKETKMVIKSENLFNDHSIKYINRDLHLWW
ncbi:unnamed protein product, partial [Rotaria sordida]